MDRGAHSLSLRADPKKRVVIVDDSQTSRAWLRYVLATDHRLEVVGEAADAAQARDVIKSTNPDVITLDIEMPGMSGLEFLRRLMTLRPMPVVMVSCMTHRGSMAAIHALSLGAIDCIQKPNGNDAVDQFSAISQRVYSAACSLVKVSLERPRAVIPGPTVSRKTGSEIVLIGASTGGVGALENVLQGLDPTGPPVVIVQHMPGPFLISFARMLDDHFPQAIGLLNDQEHLEYGQVRIVPQDGSQGKLRFRDAHWIGSFAPGMDRDLHCPSVDSLFHSAVPWAPHVTAAILTGLGKDGSSGLRALRDAGAYTIGQDRDSAVVYGMPKVAFEIGAVCEQLPVGKIGEAINRAATARLPRSRAIQ